MLENVLLFLEVHSKLFGGKNSMLYLFESVDYIPIIHCSYMFIY